MLTSWSIVFMLSLAASGDGAGKCKCNAVIHQYYTELGCSPVFVESKCCPKEYDCSNSLEARDPFKCYLNGNVYESGMDIEDVDGEACVGPICQCEAGLIDCTLIVECPEYNEYLPQGCEDQYTKGECCPTDMLCVDPSMPGIATCQYDGHIYAAGQYIYQWDEPCLSCYCQEGFDGTLRAPWCESLSCHYDLMDSEWIAYGCAPIFLNSAGHCCAIGWRCASDEDFVELAPKKPTSTSVCTFGDLTLYLGESLSEVDPCIECYCVTPPHVTCLHAGQCNSTMAHVSLRHSEEFTGRVFSRAFTAKRPNRSSASKRAKNVSPNPTFSRG